MPTRIFSTNYGGDRIKKFLFDYIEDVLIFSGLVCIVGATFTWCALAGFYVLGVVLFGLGCWFAKYPPRRRG